MNTTELINEWRNRFNKVRIEFEKEYGVVIESDVSTFTYKQCFGKHPGTRQACVGCEIYEQCLAQDI